MLFKNSPEKFWNLISSKFAASPISDRLAYETKIAKLKTCLSLEMSVLDIGCAIGTFGNCSQCLSHQLISLDMFFKNSPEKFWNLISSKYAASPIADRLAYETKITKLKTYLTPEMSVLDIGCATGTQCGDIANNVKRVTGIDISSKLLAIAEQRMAERNLDNIEFRQTSVFDETFHPDSFDLVMAFFVLHFFQDIDVVFERIHELLKPGGIFISETACLGDKNKLMGSLLRFAGHLGFLPKINLLTTQQLEQSLIRAGFSVTEKTKFSERPDAEFTLIAKKISS